VGQKIHPYGFRLGVITDHKSKWFADKDYADYVIEDDRIRKYIRERVRHAGISHIDIERTLVDFQAQVRAAQLKRELLQRSSDIPIRLVVALRHGVATRRALREHADLLRRAFPVGTRRIWSSLTTGAELGSDGILMLPDVRRNVPG
jgi:hypothetical protein